MNSNRALPPNFEAGHPAAFTEAARELQALLALWDEAAAAARPLRSLVEALDWLEENLPTLEAAFPGAAQPPASPNLPRTASAAAASQPAVAPVREANSQPAHSIGDSGPNIGADGAYVEPVQYTSRDARVPLLEGQRFWSVWSLFSISGGHRICRGTNECPSCQLVVRFEGNSPTREPVACPECRLGLEYHPCGTRVTTRPTHIEQRPHIGPAEILRFGRAGAEILIQVQTQRVPHDGHGSG